MELSKEPSKRSVGLEKDIKGYSNMMGMSKSTAAASTASIQSVTQAGIRANAYEIKKHPSKVQPKKELDSNANPYTDNKNKK
jgi:hypothetical protein